MNLRKLAFVESGHRSDRAELDGLQIFLLTTEDELELILMEDLGDLDLIFVGGREAERFADMYHVPYLPSSPTRPTTL